MVFPPISIHAPPRGATIAADTARLATFKFQFTPLREGRPFPVATRLSRSIDFNSRPSARGDALRVRSRWLLPVHFNSRPSARGDKRAWRNDANCVLISIHAPPRGATPPAQPQIRTACVFQFTPLREGRRRISCACAATFISIHAPPRGATYSTIVAGESEQISIHAPPRGATERNHRSNEHAGNFNSRPSARGDVASGTIALQVVISIHAPPRGATRHVSSFVPLHSDFNSRPSARGDAALDTKQLLTLDFNSRPSARGDLPIFRYS